MMKLNQIIAIIALSMTLNACDKDSQQEAESDMRSPFQIACEASNGEYVGSQSDERCKCGNETCDAGSVCNLETKKCPASVGEICHADAPICSNGKVYECRDNKWTYQEDCPDGLGCTSDNAKCAECSQDSCSDGKIKTCKDGLFTEPALCPSNACVDEHACKDECTGNEIVCKDSQLYRCENQKLVPSTPCEAGCNPDNPSVCASACKDGDTICVDGKIKSCKNSKYSAENPCKDNYSCAADGKTCGTCINDSKRCVVDETTGIGHMEICVNGEFEYAEKDKNCDNDASCSADGLVCGSCLNGDMRCVDDETTGIGHMEICVNGAFEYIEKDKNCDNDASCSADGLACGSCLNGAMRCVDDETTGIGHMEKCIHGEFEYAEKDKNCDNDYSCDIEANTCGECHNLDVICKNETRNNYKDSGVVYTCEKGKFNTGEECIDDKYVRASCNKEGTACGLCLNNYDKCIKGNPSQVFACADGGLSPKEACPNGCMPFEARCAP